MNDINIESLETDDLLSSYLTAISRESWFLERLRSCRIPADFQKELQDIVNTLERLDIQKHGESSSDVESVVRLCRDLATLAHGSVAALKEDFSEVTLLFADKQMRSFQVDISFPGKYPTAAPIVSSLFPKPIEFNWTRYSCINDIVAAINQSIKENEDLIQILSEVDQNCRVIEPARPTFSSTVRRIALEKSCSVIISINPSYPKDVCDMVFLGPSSATLILQQKFQKNISKWSSSQGILENIEAVLEESIPRRIESTESSDDACCAICYLYELHSSEDILNCDHIIILPDSTCPNEKCKRHFHTTCLIQWLQSLPGSRSAFGTIFGSCPYCSENIAAKTASRI